MSPRDLMSAYAHDLMVVAVIAFLVGALLGAGAFFVLRVLLG